MKCSVCDTPIPNKKYGRPRDFCSDDCANYSKFKTAMIRALERINLSTKCSKEIRADLFRLANELKRKESK